MGITWRSAMPLLSTLAALVIIVHSAEEGLDREVRDRRYDLRPRLLDTRPTQNEQPWRVVRAEPIQQQPAQDETWNDPQDEPPVRRRLGRKRKRRPPALTDDEEPLTMTTLPDEESREAREHVSETGRRRKNIRPNRWVETTSDTERPIRRRGQRRKRPSLNNWPVLSEFNGLYRNNNPHENEREATTKIETDKDDYNDDEDIFPRQRFVEDYTEKKISKKIRRPVLNDNGDKERTKIRQPVPRYRKVAQEDDDEEGLRYVIDQENQNQEDKPLAKEDKSLSEFSMEVMGRFEPPNTDNEFVDVNDKLREKSPGVIVGMDKAREQEPIDPITLKDILKRSNGTSLSEILQQHNLTLADLLNGKENAIAVLKSEKILQSKPVDDLNTTNNNKNEEIYVNNKVNTKASEVTQNDVIIEHTTLNTNQNTGSDIDFDKGNLTNIGVLSVSEPADKENNVTILTSTDNNKDELSSVNKEEENKKPVALENRNSGIMVKRRYPGTTVRRKLRMHPMVNNTFKSQINRDLIALSARRYIQHNRRNSTKLREWREMIPLMINTTDNKKEQKDSILATTTSVPEETTITDSDEAIETTIVNDFSTRFNVTENEPEVLSTEVTEPTTITIEILATELDVSVTERPILSRPKGNASGLRRQAFNNRLKKKRLKQRTSTTEVPQDDIMKNLLELGGLVSSSEFIARTQKPKATSPNDYMETVTELEDFLTTEISSKSTSMQSTRYPSTREFAKSSDVTQAPIIISTEETAKIEIEEILNDTRTSAKLSKILKERNMTLNELLEHRERGSSHVHLADIFHNASREPNPPEPFLSKSLLEPISKETYPLRAILEANSHEQANKATTVDPIYTNHVNIPVIMDFGNNVNENAENMGIMSLFNNFTKGTTLPEIEKSTLQQDSKGTPYKSTIIAVNATDDDDTTRESRMLNDDQDMISWNEIFSMIRRNQKNETKALEKLTNELPPPETYKKIILEEDIDGDGLIVLADLQHLRDTDKKVTSGSEEKIEFNSYEGTETPMEPGILSKAPSSAKSVTVATASIVGLAMILFLLTYAALKWKQQRTIVHKKTFGDERIPSPVFENRKVKKNCSSRSISPMLPTSNIYTMNTLDSQTGKDSPEYMWDTLRKPFQ